MDTTVIVALISLCGSLVGTFAGIMASSKITVYRIEQLEKKMDKFGGIEARIYELESHNKIQDTRIENLTEDTNRIISDIRTMKGGVKHAN